MAEQAAWEHHVEEKSIPAADPEPSQAEIDAAIRDTPEFLDRWVCLYDPTMNDDWHDDILCSKGMSAYERPYLLDGDPFVEYDEIMAAASEYEDWLNQNR